MLTRTLGSLVGPFRSRLEQARTRAHFKRAVQRGDADAMADNAAALLRDAASGDAARAVLGDLMAATGDTPVRAAFLDILHDRNPDSELVAETIARHALVSGDKVRLMRHADSLLRLPLAAIPTPLKLADRLSRNGSHDKAMILLTQLHAAGISQTQVCESAMKIAEKAGDEPAAQDWAGRLLDAVPGHARALWIRARYHYLRREDAAEAEYLERIRFRAASERWISGHAAQRLMDLGKGEAAHRLLAACMAFEGPPTVPELAARIRSGTERDDSDAVLAACRDLGALPHETRFSNLLMTAAQHLRRAGRAADADEVERGARRIGASDHLPPLADWYPKSRAALLAARAGHDAAADPWRVSYLCPIHRPADIPNLVAQIGRQTWANAEAVVVPNGAVTADAIRAAWTIDITLRIVECPVGTLIGGLLNAAVAAADGDVLMRIDADSLHFPAYTADMVAWLRMTGAAMILKSRAVILMEEQGRLIAKPDDDIIGSARFGQEGGGSTLSGVRRVFDTMPFPDDVYLGEDTLFMQRCIAAGMPVHFVDPFNFLSIRKASGAGHTWDVTEFQLMAGGAWHVAGTAADIDRLIVVPRG